MLDSALAAARPPLMTPRQYGYALFDVGALHCRARNPRCTSCPLARNCRSRARLAAGPPTPPPRRQPPYAGSIRQLRGAILAIALSARGPRTIIGLRRRVAAIPAAARPGAFETALDGLRADGLIDADRFTGRSSR